LTQLLLSVIGFLYPRIYVYMNLVFFLFILLSLLILVHTSYRRI